ncbi:MAG: helix-turn-helix transcriptional regulator [Candidatus Izemoplasmatales bacterium]|nr:helix-turn-helix transcriptional regulator [Candidatus Izemoplasmatales bacterium]
MLGKNMEFHRKRNQLSLEELAEKMAIDVSTIRQWEHNRSIPSADQCRQLASILKLPCDYFQSGSSQEKTNGFIYYNHQENEAKERLTRREILGIISLFSGIILLLILAAIAFLEPLSESAGGSQISGGITAYWNHYPLYAGLMIVSFGLTVGGILLVFLLKKHSAIWEKKRETTEE